MQKLILSYFWTYVVFYYHMLLTSETLQKLQCFEGNNVTFVCTCCSKHYRFKKLFQGGYILLDGEVKQSHKYHFDNYSTRITLKDCTKVDEGTYVWMCAERNVNSQFLLEVIKPTTGFGDLPKDCSVGGKVSFKCPCCPDELDTCRFKKLGQKEYIVRGGLLHVRHHRFEFNEQKTHVTLKKCNGGDEGTYMWMCEKCNVFEKFAMKIHYADHHEHSADVHKSTIQEIVLSFILILFISLLAPWKYSYRSFWPSCLGGIIIASLLIASKKHIWQSCLGNPSVLEN